ncbi:branched-chain amino acid ABC transporter permease [Azoarcus communis]|uniref:branched-chain amino acid ABC transporter permease n=1 Tax=Parazoarcus communis TaxID=41977 RepID=UPI001459AA03|nr:branched-chain amino acid ABC transporter permease [Parazoarcus communis]NMG47746.1 branched-chain amino acid ABC transporter permease [Parazoarcus communis]
MKSLSLTPGQLTGLEAAFWLLLASSFWLMPDHLTLLSQILILGLFAVSLDLALGYAGILTVGHAALFGCGAYAAGLLAKHGWGEPFSGLLLALLVCAALGYALSYLIVRGADLTRLMITIGVCVLFGELANRLSGITGGTDGLQGIVIDPVLGLFEFDLWGKTAFVYAFVVVLAMFLVTRLIVSSPFGLALRGIHDSRKRMQAIGSPVAARLRMAYCFSAALAGVAGALMAQTSQFVGIEALSFNRSAEILIILVLGGTGRLYGGLIGAIVYMLVHDWFADLNPQYWMFWLGIFLIVVVMVGRGGIMGALSRLVRIRRA